MAEVVRIKAQWTGFQGAPGVNIWHFGPADGSSGSWALPDAQACADRVKAFYQGIQIQLPPTVQIAVSADAEVFNVENGSLQRVLGIVAGNPIPGNGGASGFASAAGAVVSWRTDTVRNRRRMRGRTFLVPLAASCYETNGTLTSSAISTIQGAATTLRTAAGGAVFGIWARPKKDISLPIPGGGYTFSGGQFGKASSNNVPDMSAVLRSRRD